MSDERAEIVAGKAEQLVAAMARMRLHAQQRLHAALFLALAGDPRNCASPTWASSTSRNSSWSASSTEARPPTGGLTHCSAWNGTKPCTCRADGGIRRERLSPGDRPPRRGLGGHFRAREGAGLRPGRALCRPCPHRDAGAGDAADLFPLRRGRRRRNAGADGADHPLCHRPAAALFATGLFHPHALGRDHPALHPHGL